jgi:dihydrofolate reductase
VGIWPTSSPEAYLDKAEIVSGPLKEVVASLNARGFRPLYIDGGKTIQSFLQADLIDELTITQIPILLGGGVPLFSTLPKPLEFEHINTQVYLDAMVKTRYLVLYRRGVYA